MRKLLVHTAIMAALLSVGLLEPKGSFADAASRQTRMVTVPPLTGKSLRAAFADMNDVGLTPVVKGAGNAGPALGLVVEQDPAAGTEVAPRSRVVLTAVLTELAIEPGTSIDEATGQTRVWGQLIVHRAFNIDLKAQTQHVPLLAITYQGRDYVRGDDVEPLHFAEARTDAIVERLSLAWTVLDDGGTLEVATDATMPPDHTSIWHLTDPLGPRYGQSEPPFPAIYLRHSSLGVNSLRVLTVYPEDASAFGQPDDGHGVPTPLNPRELADYLVALLKAHYLLFHKQSTDPESYDQLEICRTKDGRIFKDIALQIHQAGAPRETPDLEAVLEEMSMEQRTRLATLAYKAPIDWRLRKQP